jgi:hypothetical protein
MRPRSLRLLAPLALAILAGGCGKTAPSPSLQKDAPATPAPSAPGVIGLATKNTTRLGGADPVTDAAAVAKAVYPGLTAATRPQAVVLVNERNWPAALAAAALASAPLGAPLLYADGEQLPDASAAALASTRPLGASALGGAQVLRVGTSAALPGSYRARTVVGATGAAATAAAVEQVLRAARGRPARAAILLVEGAPRALQMPAAGLAAESGAPILFIGANAVPAPTSAALASMHHPALYLVGAASVSGGVLGELSRLGRMTIIAAPGASPRVREGGDPVQNAVLVSRFADGSFGWGIHEAGHGLVFLNASRPLDAPAASPLSSHGDYGPLLLLGDRGSVPPVLARYLSNIEPGYTATVPPVREVYNHGWLIGDDGAISALAQAEIDAILEVAPRTSSAGQPTVPPPE